jgi:hypothetical protein
MEYSKDNSKRNGDKAFIPYNLLKGVYNLISILS